MGTRPTKTVDARKAGDRMEAKLSKRPTQRTDSASELVADSARLPEPALLSARMVQNLQRPKCPGANVIKLLTVVSYKLI